MKRMLGVLAMAWIAAPVWATIYTDTTGEVISGANLDIVSVEVSNDATDLTFSITLAADISAGGTDWGNYMVLIDSAPGGDTASNGWGRPIDMPSGMNYWLGSWVNSGGGAQVWDYDITAASTWTLTATNPVDLGQAAAGTLAFSVPLADLGLSIGNSFRFDVVSSGSGADSAIDSVSNPAQTVTDWGNQYSAVLTSEYTVIPEPATFMLLALGGLALCGRRRRLRR